MTISPQVGTRMAGNEPRPNNTLNENSARISQYRIAVDVTSLQQIRMGKKNIKKRAVARPVDCVRKLDIIVFETGNHLV